MIEGYKVRAEAEVARERLRMLCGTCGHHMGAHLINRPSETPGEFEVFNCMSAADGRACGCQQFTPSDGKLPG